MKEKFKKENGNTVHSFWKNMQSTSDDADIDGSGAQSSVGKYRHESSEGRVGAVCQRERDPQETDSTCYQ